MEAVIPYDGWCFGKERWCCMSSPSICLQGLAAAAHTIQSNCTHFTSLYMQIRSSLRHSVNCPRLPRNSGLGSPVQLLLPTGKSLGQTLRPGKQNATPCPIASANCFPSFPLNFTLPPNIPPPKPFDDFAPAISNASIHTLSTSIWTLEEQKKLNRCHNPGLVPVYNGKTCAWFSAHLGPTPNGSKS